MRHRTPQPILLAAAAVAGTWSCLPAYHRHSHWSTQPQPVPRNGAPVPLTEDFLASVLASSADSLSASEAFARAYLANALTAHRSIPLTSAASDAIANQCEWALTTGTPGIVPAEPTAKVDHQAGFPALRELLREVGHSAANKYRLIEEASETVQDELFYDTDRFIIPLSKCPLEEDELRAIQAGEGGLATLIADAAARNQDVAQRLVQSQAFAALFTLLDGCDEDNRLKSEIARALANLLTDSAARCAAESQNWVSLLREWAEDKKPDRGHLQAQAKRALFNMDSSNGSFLDDNHFLIGSLTPQGSHPQMDIVFIHGLRGDPLLTWRTQMHIDNDDICVWPRDWLQDRYPSSRIFSFGYSVSLTKWSPSSARNLSLEDQAEECLASLIAAGIGGAGPVCFITHSFGGLLAKKLLLLGSQADVGSKERQLADACVSIVFFGTPHKGSPFAKNIRASIVGSALRPSTPVAQLIPGSKCLESLAQEFQQFALDRHLEVVSVAEGRPTDLAQVRGREFKSWLVPAQTADAGIGRFVTLQRSNHQELCKPPNPTDSRYTLVVDVLQHQFEHEELLN